VTLGSLTGITLTGQQLDLTAGYVIPTTTKETAWDAAASTSHAAVTIPASANGLSLTGQEISLPVTATPTFAGLTVQAGSSGSFTVHGRDGGILYPSFFTHSDTATYAPLFVTCHYRGTQASPATSQNGDRLGAFVFQGYSEAKGGGANAAAILSGTDGAWDVGGAVNHYPGNLIFATTSDGAASYTEKVRITSEGLVLIGQTTGTEKLEVAGKIRANTAFNLNGTDGVTQAASAGKVSDVTALAGGIATAQAQVTPIADGAHNLAGITSITTTNGRITAMT